MALLARGASFLLLLALSCWCITAAAARPSPSAGTAAPGGFVESWCGGTEYPALCGATLSPYAAAVGSSPTRLSQAALTVALDGARDAAAAVRAITSAGDLSSAAAEAARDCVTTLGDAADKLRRSVDAVARLGAGGQEATTSSGGDQDVRFQVDSVRTWASAALTDAGTCMEGLKGEAVRGHVVGVAHLTANALGIVNAAMAKPVVVDICRGSCRSVPVPPPASSP